MPGGKRFFLSDSVLIQNVNLMRTSVPGAKKPKKSKPLAIVEAGRMYALHMLFCAIFAQVILKRIFKLLSSAFSVSH